jgi:hypothetical protein
MVENGDAPATVARGINHELLGGGGRQAPI